jgi:hypothetical protein
MRLFIAIFLFPLLLAAEPADESLKKQLQGYSTALEQVQQSRTRLLLSELPEFQTLLPEGLRSWLTDRGGELRVEAFRLNGASQGDALQIMRDNAATQRKLPQGYSETSFEVWTAKREQRPIVLRGTQAFIEGTVIPVPEGAQRQSFRERIDLSFGNGFAHWLTFRLEASESEDRVWISSAPFPAARSNPPSVRGFPLHTLSVPAAMLLGLTIKPSQLESDGEPRPVAGFTVRALRSVQESSAANCQLYSLSDSPEKRSDFGGRPIAQRVRNELLLAPAELYLLEAYVADPLWDTRKIQLYVDSLSGLPVYLIEYGLKFNVLRSHIFASIAGQSQLGIVSQFTVDAAEHETFVAVDTIIECATPSAAQVGSFTPGSLAEAIRIADVAAEF